VCGRSASADPRTGGTGAGVATAAMVVELPAPASRPGLSYARRTHQASLVTSSLLSPICLPGVPALTDVAWERLRPLLPPQEPDTGRSGSKQRLIVEEGVLWVARTVVSWRELPARFEPWLMVSSRPQDPDHAALARPGLFPFLRFWTRTVAVVLVYGAK
jgi:transposase